MVDVWNMGAWKYDFPLMISILQKCTWLWKYTYWKKRSFDFAVVELRILTKWSAGLTVRKAENHCLMSLSPCFSFHNRSDLRLGMFFFSFFRFWVVTHRNISVQKTRGWKMIVVLIVLIQNTMYFDFWLSSSNVDECKGVLLMLCWQILFGVL